MNELIDLSKYTVDDLQEIMLKMPQSDCPVKHIFRDGKYFRELRVKAGTVAIGLFQRYEQMNHFVQGKVIMLQEDGSTKLLEAPMKFIGPAGRKVGVIIEDMVWLNEYNTDIRDIDVLTEMFFVKPTELLEYQAHEFAKLTMTHDDSRTSFKEALLELDVTELQVREQSEFLDDQIELPPDDYKVIIGLSPIEGYGVIATSNIVEGEYIGPARINDKRTPLGRYTNHGVNPNAEMINIGNTIYLRATCPIKGAIGSLSGEEVTVDYRAVRKLIESEKLCQE